MESDVLDRLKKGVYDGREHRITCLEPGDVDDAIAEIERLLWERDEAREDARRRLEEANSQQRIAIKREEERDEARAEVQTLDFRLAAEVENANWVKAKREAAETENTRLRAVIEEAIAEWRRPYPVNVDALMKRLRAALAQPADDAGREAVARMETDRERETFPRLPRDQAEKPMTHQERVQAALECIHRHGGHDGEHHKQWVLDQVVQILTCFPDRYAEWVTAFKAGPDGPDTYHWDEGVAP